MRITETDPKPVGAILPGADFADAWRLDDIPPGNDAESIARQYFGKAPRWVRVLLALRNVLVAPFGLTTRPHGRIPPRHALAFPVVASQPGRVVLGFDDRHLDFRLVIEMSAVARDRLAATATTYVRTHNMGGRLYLMLVKPFHRRIVPAMLASAAQAA